MVALKLRKLELFGNSATSVNGLKQQHSFTKYLLSSVLAVVYFILCTNRVSNVVMTWCVVTGVWPGVTARRTATLFHCEGLRMANIMTDSTEEDGAGAELAWSRLTYYGCEELAWCQRMNVSSILLSFFLNFFYRAEGRQAVRVWVNTLLWSLQQAVLQRFCLFQNIVLR